MCYSCGKDLTNDKKIKYAGKVFCSECLKLIYESEPKVMAIYLSEDIYEECFSEFA